MPHLSDQNEWSTVQIASHQEDQPDMAPYWCGRVALALAQQADDLAQYLVSKALEAHCDRKVRLLAYALFYP